MRSTIARSLLVLPAALLGTAGCFFPTDPGGALDEFDFCPGAVSRVVVSPSDVALRIGDTATVFATVIDERGEADVLCGVEWSSSNPDVARVVDPTEPFGKGILGVGPGSAWVRAMSKGKTDSILVTMSTATVASVTVEAPATALLVGQTMPVAATARDSAGNVLPVRQVRWRTTSSAIMQVTTRGLVVSRGTGSADVEATVDGRVGALTIASSRAAPTIVFGDISAGSSHSCALVGGDGRAAGTAYCWGWSMTGALGTGDTERREYPAPVAGSRSYSRISAGGTHTCADGVAGAVWCWGDNLRGQLGDGTTTTRLSPVRVTTTVALHGVASASEFTCALDADGSPYCWGAWARRSARTPLRIQTTARFATLHAAGQAMCGLTTSGAAHCWGNVADRAVDASALVGGGLAFRAIGGMGRSLCGVATDGRAHCWGVSDARYWDPAGGARATPQPVPGGADFVDVAVSSTGLCAVTTTGALWCMGQLASQGSAPWTLVQVARGADHPLARLTGGGNHACAIDVVGGGWCWGQSFYGETGVGDVYSSRPLQLRIP